MRMWRRRVPLPRPSDFLSGSSTSKKTHRNIEFVVNSSDGVEWTWDAYPLKDFVVGLPLHGKATGTEADAVKACLKAIDAAYDEKST
jgi:hypothetical protein